jgi:hypothetical protein
MLQDCGNGLLARFQELYISNSYVISFPNYKNQRKKILTHQLLVDSHFRCLINNMVAAETQLAMS